MGHSCQGGRTVTGTGHEWVQTLCTSEVASEGMGRPGCPCQGQLSAGVPVPAEMQCRECQRSPLLSGFFPPVPCRR